MPKIAVIADDLTGANDTGVQFSKFGLASVVFIDALLQPDIAKKADVIVLDTDSRAISAQEAALRVTAACRKLLEQNVKYIYKKIDSTLRGNLSAEIAAACAVLKPELTIIAPAFPKLGRVTEGGSQLLNGVPVSLTEIAHDPQTPVTEAYLPKLLQRGDGKKIGVVPLHTVREGKEAIAGQIKELLAKGEDWIVIDAASEENLCHIVQASLAFEKVLWVGSAGLAEQIPPVLGWNINAKEAAPPRIGQSVNPVVIAGSASAVTRAQVETYIESCGAFQIIVDPDAALADAGAEAGGKAAAALPELGRRGLVISCSRNRRSELAAKALSLTLGLITAKLIEAGADGLFLTGGETAVSACRALGAAGMEILSEVEPGIPLGRIVGGPYHGLPVVTKAGAFGNADVIVKAVGVLKKGSG